jgi:hypothetical protein
VGRFRLLSTPNVKSISTLERFGESVDRGRASITTSEFRDALETLDERAKKKAKDAPF